MYFPTEDRYLAHGDDPCGTLSWMVPRIAAGELLVGPTDFASWFGSGVSPEVRAQNVSRRSMVLHATYQSQYLLQSYCSDTRNGLSHANGTVYSALKDFYGLAELESSGLWTALTQKAARLGGCPVYYY